jgi:zinc protease
MERRRAGRRHWLAIAVLAAASFTATNAAGQEQAGARAQIEPRAWEHETSDIPVDPRVRFGHLENGLRWAWAVNAEPKERCYLRLHVDVGSLAETEDELGLAHFLEHMAFNGSKHFAAGTLIEWFQSQGMSFGADTNASTGFSETVYKLNLPDSDKETLGEGLLVLRDFADGLLLAAEEVESEKGVIDGEQRERDSAGYRVSEQRLELVFDGTLFPKRLPIGNEETRAAFSPETVRAFYERWYRPQNMTLVLVGDLGELDPVPLFEEFFGDMAAGVDPLAQEPDTGEITRFDHVFSIYEEEIPSIQIAVQRLEPFELEPVTLARWVEDLPLGYARSMLNQRFAELTKTAEAPFLGAGVRGAAAFEVLDGELLTITCPPESWREAVIVGVTELRRALELGFQQAELDELRANALRSMDEAVERESTAPSTTLLNRIVLAAENRFVPTNAVVKRSTLAPAVESLTIEQCHEALQEAWSKGELSLSAMGNLDLGAEADELLREAYAAGWETELEAAEEIVVAEFAYASQPDEPGEIVSREHVEDLDFHQIRFANGVLLNVKRTEFKEKQIFVAMRFGEGRLSLDPSRLVLDWVGTRIFNGGGLVAHSQDELRRILAGKTVGIGFSSGTAAFALGGATTAEDLLLQCELMCAFLSAPGWRDEGLIQLRRQIPLLFDGLAHQHQGPAVQEFMPAIFSGDPRFAIPTEEEALACEIGPVREWLEPQLAEGPIEISFVGDLDIEQTIATAARTFGALPERREPERYEERRDVPAPLGGIHQEHTIETQIPKSMVLIVCPLTDGIEIERDRAMKVLNSIVNDRLRIEVREKLGAAYSPGSGLQVSRHYPGVGLLMIQAMSEPDKVDTLVEACLEVIESLATEGVTEEEIDRLREPILKAQRDAKRKNGYWAGVLSESQGRAEHLDEVRSADAFYAGYTAEDIAPLAAAYLKRANASVLVVNPASPEE